jgi:hypothetical protein
VPGYGCQVHHADKDWKDGGATNIDTLGFACEPDNMLVENGGWRTRKLPNGDAEWIPHPTCPSKAAPTLITTPKDSSKTEKVPERRHDGCETRRGYRQVGR